MAWSRLPIEIGDGLMLDASASEAEGRWHDGDRVRFVRGRAQPVGGWQRRTATTLDGRTRALHAWINTVRDRLLAAGTHTKLYVAKDGAWFDVTPAGLAAGLADAGGVGGYGQGLFGTGTFGQSVVGAGVLRTWSLDNWGDQLLANPRGAGLYRWQGDTAAPATLVPNAPAVIDSMFVDPNGYVVALGANQFAGGQFDPMLVRWSDQNDLTVWAPANTNNAGEFSLREGGRIVAGRAGAPSLIWTDTALYEMRLLDADFVFGFNPLGTGCGLIGPSAVAERDGLAWWWSTNGQFYEFAGGAPTPIPCPLRASTVNNLVVPQAEKITAAINGAFNEVWWFYPDARDGTGENSRYVCFNFVERHWTAGRLDRTAWLDAGVFSGPIAVSPAGVVFDHEIGASADGAPLQERLVSGAIDLADGDTLIRLDGLMPDLRDQQGVAVVRVLMRGAPQGGEQVFGPYTVTPASDVVPFQSLGRQARLVIEGASTPSFWRLGDPRWDLKQTGMRR